MKTKLVLAAIAAAAAPGVFAQAATVQSSTTVTTVTAPVLGSQPQRPLPHGAIAELPAATVVVAPSASASSTAVLGASAAPVTVHRYAFNVPLEIQSRADFRRWQGLL
jgi:hypothetical protein